MTETINRKKGSARLREFAGRYNALEYAGCIFSAISSVLMLGPYICIYYVLKEVLDSGGDISIMDTDLMIHYGLLALILVAASLLLYGIGLICTHVAAFKTMRDLRNRLMSHLCSLPLGYHVNNQSGKIRKVIDTNVGELEGYMAHQLPDLSGALIAPIAVVAVMMIYDWRLGLLCLAPIVAGFLVQFAWVMRSTSKGFIGGYQEHLADMENSAVEYVRGISVVKVFGQTVHSFKNFYSSIMRYKDFVMMYTMSMRTAMNVFTTLVNSAFFFLIPAGIIIGQAATGNSDFLLSFVFYVAFIPASSKAMMKLLYLGSSSMMMQDAVSRIDVLLTAKPVAEPLSPKMPQRNDLEFDNVTFTYEGNAAPAVSGVSFTAEEGKVTALVGASGSGKTTIANLVPRFWDADKGTVSIGGIDVREIRTDDLMEKVGFVFQSSHIFKATIYENIIMGRPSASREDVLKAAEAAQCSDFIERLPNGIDTMIGPKGTYLSGGEQQRIALARAVLKSTPVILLDEATAFADPENEQKIQKAMDSLMKDKTVLMIAHRLSTVRNADKIIVMDGGKIVEQGSHDELMSIEGKYASMWSDYQRGLKWNIRRAEA